jgi:hypothetical protein
MMCLIDIPYNTEEHLKRHSKVRQLLVPLRGLDTNENMLPGSYFPKHNGELTYPWRNDARFPTSSLMFAKLVSYSPSRSLLMAPRLTVTEYVTNPNRLVAGNPWKVNLWKQLRSMDLLLHLSLFLLGGKHSFVHGKMTLMQWMSCFDMNFGSHAQFTQGRNRRG